MLPESLLGCLSAFEDCFTAPSYRRFLALMGGWLVCIGKHTVTGVVRAAGIAEQDVSGSHRFFSRGVWDPQKVGFVLLRLVLRLVPTDRPIAMTLDDTLARHTGKHIASAGMHREPLRSTGARPFFHFGHKWVVLAVVVTMPWGKRFSLPVLVQLHRSETAAMAAKQVAECHCAGPGSLLPPTTAWQLGITAEVEARARRGSSRSPPGYRRLTSRSCRRSRALPVARRSLSRSAPSAACARASCAR